VQYDDDDNNNNNNINNNKNKKNKHKMSSDIRSVPGLKTTTWYTTQSHNIGSRQGC